jgi:peptide/nickel transport system substrate-binding protein
MRRAGFWLVVALVAALSFAGCGGSESTSTSGQGTDTGKVVKGGILRIGTINYVDSLNPFNYIESQAVNAFIMLYPQLVQYKYEDGKYEIEGDWAKSWETSPDGKDWTFHLIPGGQWSDGKPLTADDAVWSINTTVKFADGPTAVQAAALQHVESAEAPDDQTLVIHYESPVGNVLAQLEQFFVLPRQVYEPLAEGNGKGLKTFQPQQHLPLVSAGVYRLKSYEKKGTTVYTADPNYWGPKSNAEAVALTYYTNADAMLSDLKGGQLDWVDQVPFSAVDAVKKDSNLVVETVPGAETTNITWNSNLSMCVDRDKIIEVVFSGYADTVESLPGHISPLENPNLGPLEHDCDAANQMLDDLGYTKGPDGTRVAPATTGKNAQPEHKMSYEIIVPNSLNFNGEREFDIVKEGFAEAGVEVTIKPGGDSTAAYALETGDNCDAAKSTGYDSFDIAMWDWIGYVDPDFMLSVVTKGQWCSWSDTGWDSPEFDALYDKQGTTIDPEERKQIVWEMQQMIYDNFLYTQLVNLDDIEAHTKAWDGFSPALDAYSKKFYSQPHKVG